MNLVQRVQSPTTGIFKMIRNIGLGLAGVSGVVLAAPISLPAVIVTIAGYTAVAGGVMSAISQLTTVKDDANSTDSELVTEG